MGTARTGVPMRVISLSSSLLRNSCFGGSNANAKWGLLGLYWADVPSAFLWERQAKVLAVADPSPALPHLSSSSLDRVGQVGGPRQENPDSRISRGPSPHMCIRAWDKRSLTCGLPVAAVAACVHLIL